MPEIRRSSAAANGFTPIPSPFSLNSEKKNEQKDSMATSSHSYQNRWEYRPSDPNTKPPS